MSRRREIRPVMIDLCCGAGGAARGYNDAGYEVIGIDLHPQKHYPYRFEQMDAIRFLEHLLWLLDGGYSTLTIRPDEVRMIHISAPCQRWSRQLACRPELAQKYPDLITPARRLLEPLYLKHGIDYVIENVPQAPLLSPVMLCGLMFGRELYRHRHFESSFHLPQLAHPKHVIPASKAGHWVPGTIMSVAGHVAPVEHARRIMEIDWTTRDELTEAIPPYYAHWVARNSPLFTGRT